ncbi:MAG TPA: type II toxin-antitoxin system RelE/ParE family toxin [Thermoanaerobaculia bacterium]|nr:type II toxin-antitoxin system RelE/ParE family toxin [Thermoanaerobaculia bacterium]
MGKIKWTQESERWLREIHDYIAVDNPAAALRTVQGIYEKAESLARFPERGYRYHDQADSKVRILLYGHYRIAYLIKENRDIEILGVFHGALDITRFLG